MKPCLRCKETLAIQTRRVILSDLNPHQTLFGGTLLQMIDITASISASRLARRRLVTASIDSMNFIHPIYVDHSVCVETYVSGVGGRSLEVFAKVMGEDLLTGERYLAATCFLTFVVFPNEGEESFELPDIIPESDEEKMVCEGYPKRRQARLANRKEQEEFNRLLSKQVPWLQE